MVFPTTCFPRIQEDFINGGSTADPCSFVPWCMLSLFMGEYHIRGTKVDNTVVREGKKNISEAEFLDEI